MDRFTDTICFEHITSSLVVHPDKHLLAVGGARQVDVLDLVRLVTIKSIDTSVPHPNGVKRLAASRDHLVTGGKEGETYLWDWGGQSSTKIGCVGPIKMSADGRFVVSTATGNRTAMWNIQAKTLLQYQRHNYPITAVTISPDGKLLASGDTNGLYMVYDTQNNSLMAEINLGRGISINDMCFHPDGQTLCWTDNQGSWGYHPISGINNPRYCSQFNWSGHANYSCEFNAVGDLLAMGSYDGRVYLVEYPTGNRVECLSGHNRHVFSASWLEGDRVASAAQDQTARLWNVRRSHLIA